MKVVVVDGMGGGIGAQVVARLKQIVKPPHALFAVGTNAAATGAMVKAGAESGATGENAIRYNCASADVIIGPVGIVIANSLLGEISPEIATAIAASPAVKILIPLIQPHVEFVAVEPRPLSAVLDQVVNRVSALLDETAM